MNTELNFNNPCLQLHLLKILVKQLLTSLIFIFSIINLTGQCNCNSNIAMDFDGNDDQLRIYNLAMPLDFSITTWFKSPIAPNGGLEDRIFSFPQPNSLQVGLDDSNNEGKLWVYDGASFLNFSWGISLHDDQWHHLVLTKKGTTRSLYLDGSMIVSWNGSENVHYGEGSYMRIGNWPGSVNQRALFYGQIDEFKIYDIALDQDQILDDLDCNTSNLESNQIVYWSFENGIADGDNTTITHVQDFSGNNHDIELISFNLTGNRSNFVGSSFDLSNCEVQEIPTISQWGISVIFLFLLIFGTVVLKGYQIEEQFE